MQGRVGVSLSVESADTIPSVYSPFSVLLKVLFRGLCVLFFWVANYKSIRTYEHGFCSITHFCCHSQLD